MIAGCEGGFRLWEMPRPGQRPVPGGAVRGTVGSGNVHSVAMHPQGWLAATAGQHIEVWSCPHGRLVATLPAPSPATRVEFSADGQLLLAIVGEETVLGWPVSDTPGKRRLHGHEGAGVPSIAFSADGKWLASGSKDRTVKVWEAGTGQLLHTLTEHHAAIEAVALSHDGRLLATGDVQGGVYVWDVTSGRNLARLGDPNAPPGQVWRLQFDGPGQNLAAGGGQGFAVWSIERKEADVVVTLHSQVRADGVYDLAMHISGKSLVCQVWMKGKPTSQLLRFDLRTKEKPRKLEVAARNQVRGLHFDASGHRLGFVTPAGELGWWDWDRDALIPGPRLPARFWAPAPGGRWAASSMADRSIVLNDLDTGERVLTLPPEESDIWTIAWSPDGERLAVGTSDGAVAVWDLVQVRSALAQLGIVMPIVAGPMRAAN